MKKRAQPKKKFSKELIFIGLLAAAGVMYFIIKFWIYFMIGFVTLLLVGVVLFIKVKRFREWFIRKVKRTPKVEETPLQKIADKIEPKPKSTTIVHNHYVIHNKAEKPQQESREIDLDSVPAEKLIEALNRKKDVRIGGK